MKDMRTLAQKLSALAGDSEAFPAEREAAREQLAKLQLRTAPPPPPRVPPVSVGGAWQEDGAGFAWNISVTRTDASSTTSFTFVSFR